MHLAWSLAVRGIHALRRLPLARCRSSPSGSELHAWEGEEEGPALEPRQNISTLLFSLHDTTNTSYGRVLAPSMLSALTNPCQYQRYGCGMRSCSLLCSILLLAILQLINECGFSWNCTAVNNTVPQSCSSTTEHFWWSPDMLLPGTRGLQLPGNTTSSWAAALHVGWCSVLNCNAVIAALCIARVQKLSAEIKLLLLCMVLDHYVCNVGTSCKELCDYWFLDVKEIVMGGWFRSRKESIHALLLLLTERRGTGLVSVVLLIQMWWVWCFLLDRFSRYSADSFIFKKM